MTTENTQHLPIDKEDALLTPPHSPLPPLPQPGVGILIRITFLMIITFLIMSNVEELLARSNFSGNFEASHRAGGGTVVGETRLQKN